jgi:hypothetical protein
MASVIYGGERELNLYTAGEPHPSMLQYMREQADYLGQYIQQTGSTFAQNVLNAYNSFYSDDALRHARAGLSRVKSYFQGDKIRDLESIYDIQQASPIMQRYLMSQPDLREMYNQGRCYGYEGSYRDPSPGMIRDQDYNYRRVMNSMLVQTPATEALPDGGWKFVTYIEELMEGDRELDIMEQVPIMRTWDRIRYSLAHSVIDPSSPTGEML